MISPARITELLSRRAALSADDKRQLEQVVIRFPFFVPAQLLLAAQRPNAAPALQPLYLNPVMASGHLPAMKLKQARQQPKPGDVTIEEEKVTPILPEENTQAQNPEPATLQQQNAATMDADSKASESENENTEEQVATAVASEKNQEAIAVIESEEETPASMEGINDKTEPEVTPVYTEDYFRYEGIKVASDLPDEQDLQPQQSKASANSGQENEKTNDKDKSLMVMMSFTDWLMHYRNKSQAAKDEEEDRLRVRSAWQREKLAAALQEEDEEIPEQVFEMAVNSLNQEDGLVSESLAAILAKQGKTEKAREMYQKLSLKYPQKSAYFASQIENLKREENQ